MPSRTWGAIRHDGDWEIRIWAPSARSVSVTIGEHTLPARMDATGYWHARAAAEPGAPYRFRVDDTLIPDPACRLQMGDVHGASVLVDHDAYRWTEAWKGREWPEAVLYELHIGTFTPEGTFAAAAGKLAQLASLGITGIEIMPIGQWSGNRGWGYDGVLPFAPHLAYGRPDDVKQFVERAHSLGMMVILDVVMNHLGPDGAYLHASTPEFFDSDRKNPWGAAIDFSQPAVRSFWIECALSWLEDYHLDGLRLDAVHQIAGPGSDQFFNELGTAVQGLKLGRPLHIILEDERNEPVLREKPGYVANWNDDFHHAVHVALTGEEQDYYESFAVDPIGDLVLALEKGHVEQGQKRKGRAVPRGAPSEHLPPIAFVNSTQTHDQVGNRPFGERLIALADPQALQMVFSLLLVSPYIPMIFMGEERGETAPFLFFADYEGELGQRVREGRAAEFQAIAGLGDAIPDPTSLETFEASRLDWTVTDGSRQWQDLTRTCLEFRTRYVVPLLKSGHRASIARRCGDGSLEAQWTFRDGRLSVALNLGSVGAFSQDDEDAGLRFNAIESDPFAFAAWVR
ncbi:malto-oligosyltrehalose trehalohydrolase [Pelagibacterium limicola]|uniref:malto-oligosyltrehalose trehalohydrolase n=1 Tax=Pelagibacterium limicola TaxID=2791022 RepID=UPI0018AF821C|nr:malto-oligosyltrehalose trehalohydrolase [Pelagibacterium limicola]